MARIPRRLNKQDSIINAARGLASRKSTSLRHAEIPQSCFKYWWQQADDKLHHHYVQGFRKVDPNRWEFANEGFLRGQKHLLKNIHRRKSAQQQQLVQSFIAGPVLEVGKYGGADGEIETLKRDKNLLMLEVVRLRQQQQSTQQEMKTMAQRLQTTEQRQQQMITFLAKAMQNPTFMSQLVQQNEQAKRLEMKKKPRLPKPGSIYEEESGSSTIDTGQVEYSASSSDGGMPSGRLEALLHEIRQGHYRSNAEGQNPENSSLESDVKMAAAAGGERQIEVSDNQGSQSEIEKGERVAREVKFEVPENLDDLNTLQRGNGLFLLEDFEAEGDNIFWEQLLGHEQEAADSDTEGSDNPFDYPGTSGTPCQSNEWWESKPNVDDLTEQLGHLGSDP